MKPEESIFKRRKALFDKMLAYGFECRNNAFFFSKDFESLKFRAEVTVTEDSKVDSRVIDLDTNEEFLPIYTVMQSGSFVSRVLREYTQILQDIAENCFTTELFIFPQANRLAVYIREYLSDKPYHPFKKYPEIAAFRPLNLNKWYALVMNIKYSKLVQSHQNDSDKEIEIVNLKASAEKVPLLIKHKGIYRAYHMNHEKWISVILDDSLTDEELFLLVTESRNAVLAAK